MEVSMLTPSIRIGARPPQLLQVTVDESSWTLRFNKAVTVENATIAADASETGVVTIGTLVGGGTPTITGTGSDPVTFEDEITLAVLASQFQAVSADGQFVAADANYPVVNATEEPEGITPLSVTIASDGLTWTVVWPEAISLQATPYTFVLQGDPQLLGTLQSGDETTTHVWLTETIVAMGITDVFFAISETNYVTTADATPVPANAEVPVTNNSTYVPD